MTALINREQAQEVSTLYWLEDAEGDFEPEPITAVQAAQALKVGLIRRCDHCTQYHKDFTEEMGETTLEIRAYHFNADHWEEEDWQALVNKVRLDTQVEAAWATWRAIAPGQGKRQAWRAYQALQQEYQAYIQKAVA